MADIDAILDEVARQTFSEPYQAAKARVRAAEVKLIDALRCNSGLAASIIDLINDLEAAEKALTDA